MTHQRVTSPRQLLSGGRSGRHGERAAARSGSVGAAFDIGLLQRTIGNQAVQRLLFKAPAVRVQRAVARAAVGAPTRAEPHVFVPSAGPAALSVTSGDTVAVGVSGKAGGALTAKLTAGQDFVAIGTAKDAVNQQEVRLTEQTGHDQQLLRLFVKGLAATGTDAAQTPATIVVSEEGQPVETISVHVWTSLALSAVPWLATVKWGDASGKPQVAGKEFTTAVVMKDAQAYLAPAGIELKVENERALLLDLTEGLTKGQPNKRKELEVGIPGALRTNSTFTSATTEKDAVHVVFVPTFSTLGYAYPMHMRSQTKLEVVNANWITDLVKAQGLARVVIIAVEGEYVGDALVRRGGEVASDEDQRKKQEEYVTREIGVDVAHEIGHKLSLPHLEDNSASVTLPFEAGEATKAALTQQLMFEHNPVKLNKGTPSEADLKRASQWLPQTASITSGQAVHAVRGGALSPSQVRFMRASLTAKVGDVDVELAEVAAGLEKVRATCKTMLGKSIGEALDVRRGLRDEGAPAYLKDSVLNAIRSSMLTAQESKGTFDLLEVVKRSDASFRALCTTYGEQAFSKITPLQG